MQGTFEELGGSPKIAIDDQGMVTAERKFYLSAWNDWPEFMGLLRGRLRRVGLLWMVEIPQAHFPGIELLKATAVSVEPYDPDNPDQTTLPGVSSGLSTYSGGALVRAQYKGPDPDDDDKPETEIGTFLTWEQDIGMDVLSIPGRNWRWLEGPPDDLHKDLPVGIRVPIAEHTLTWTNVISPPRAAIRELRGKVNKFAFLGAPAGCVLFVGARITTSMQTDGTTTYSLVYTFHEKTVTRLTNGSQVVGHNYFYFGPGHNGEHWFEIAGVDSGEPVYQQGDLSRLFRYASP